MQNNIINFRTECINAFILIGNLFLIRMASYKFKEDLLATQFK